MADRPFGVIEGGRVAGGYICPWCGDRFLGRWISSDGVPSLEEHFRTNPECSANRNTNNPTNSKNDVVDAEIPTLRIPDDEDREA